MLNNAKKVGTRQWRVPRGGGRWKKRGCRFWWGPSLQEYIVSFPSLKKVANNSFLIFDNNYLVWPVWAAKFQILLCIDFYFFLGLKSVRYDTYLILI